MHKNEGTFSLKRIREDQIEPLKAFIKNECDCEIKNDQGTSITIEGEVSGFESASAAIRYAELESREQTAEGQQQFNTGVGSLKEQLDRQRNAYADSKNAAQDNEPSYQEHTTEDGRKFQTIENPPQPSGVPSGVAPSVGYAADGSVANAVIGSNASVQQREQGEAKPPEGNVLPDDQQPLVEGQLNNPPATPQNNPPATPE